MINTGSNRASGIELNLPSGKSPENLVLAIISTIITSLDNTKPDGHIIEGNCIDTELIANFAQQMDAVGLGSCFSGRRDRESKPA